MKKIIFFIIAAVLAVSSSFMLLLPCNVKAESSQNGIVATVSADGKYISVSGQIANASGRKLNNTFSFVIFSFADSAPATKIVIKDLDIGSKDGIINYSVTLPILEDANLSAESKPNDYFLLINGRTNDKLLDDDFDPDGVDIAFTVPIKNFVVGNTNAEPGTAIEVQCEGKVIEPAAIKKAPGDSDKEVNGSFTVLNSYAFVYYQTGPYYYIRCTDSKSEYAEGFVPISSIELTNKSNEVSYRKYTVQGMQVRLLSLRQWGMVFADYSNGTRFNIANHIEPITEINKATLFTFFYESNSKLRRKSVITLADMFDANGFKEMLCQYAANIYKAELPGYSDINDIAAFLEEDEGAFKKYAEPIAQKLCDEIVEQLKALKIVNPSLDVDDQVFAFAREERTRIDKIKEIMDQQGCNYSKAFSQLPSSVKSGVKESVYKEVFEKNYGKTSYESAVTNFINTRKDNFEKVISKQIDDYQTAIKTNAPEVLLDQIATTPSGEEATMLSRLNAYTVKKAFDRFFDATDDIMIKEQEMVRATYEEIWTKNKALFEAVGAPDNYGKAIKNIYKSVLGHDVINMPESYKAYMNVLCGLNPDATVSTGSSYPFSYLFENGPLSQKLSASSGYQITEFSEAVEEVKGQLFMKTYDRSMYGIFTPGALVVFVHGNISDIPITSQGTYTYNSYNDTQTHCLAVYVGKGTFYIPAEAAPEIMAEVDFDTQNAERVSVGGYDYIKFWYTAEPGKDIIGNYKRKPKNFLETIASWFAPFNYLVFRPDHVIEPNVSFYNFSDFDIVTQENMFGENYWEGITSQEYENICEEEYKWQVRNGWMPPPLESVFGSYGN